MGNPDLEERSVSDLGERCLHWLRTVLAYRAPPARALEVGSAHGGFVAMLGWCGYDAVGLEVSPWIAEWARRRFGIRMLTGPVEEQELEAGSFDLIAAFDVLEHLEDPAGTVARLVELLAEDGALVLQTPRRPAGGASAEQLRAESDRFLEMLIPEHLHLFTEGGVRRLLSEAGLGEIAFEPALFAHYDMYLVASRRPLRRSEEPVARLAETRHDAPVRALLELRSELEQAAIGSAELERRLADSEADRAARLAQIEKLTGQLADSETDRAARLAQIEKLTGQLADSEADRAERLDRIEVLTALYRTADEDRARRLEAIEQRDAELVARQAEIEELNELCREVEREREELRAHAGRLERELAAAEGSAAALEEQSRALAAQLESSRRETETARTELGATLRRAEWLRGKSDAAVEGFRHYVSELRRRRLFRFLVGSGRWREIDTALSRLVEETGGDAPESATPEPARPAPPAAPVAATASTGVARVPDLEPAVGIDLTALLPGGRNGGAKLVATELVRGLAALAPEKRFLLLTSAGCHDELASLEGPNVRRRRVDPRPTGLTELLEEESLALLLCPMTAPPFFDPRVPLVSVVHDLQYLAYPRFFGAADRAHRNQAFRRAVARSEHLITVSEFVRDTVVREGGVSAERVTAIHDGFSTRFPAVGEEDLYAALDRRGLRREGYFLYPANCWAHKNHRMLLTAFALYRARNPDSRTDLVLTGADEPDPAPLLEAARRMGLGDAVRWLGYVSDAELAALLTGCRALLFPSLYEGFGMPVLEAMAFERPVVASNVTSLPEVAGDAALLVDPRRPGDLAAAMERIVAEPELVADLRRRGRLRVEAIGDGLEMARRYLGVVEKVLAAPRRASDALAGVHADRWSASKLIVGRRGDRTLLELELNNPRGEPVLVRTARGEHVVAAGARLAIELSLEDLPNPFVVDVTPTFRPAGVDGSDDHRELGLLVIAARLRGGELPELDLLEVEE